MRRPWTARDRAGPHRSRPRLRARARRSRISVLPADDRGPELIRGGSSAQECASRGIQGRGQGKSPASYRQPSPANRAETAKVQARIDRYDSRSLAKARTEQAVLEGERLAFDLEKSRQAQLYESRISRIEEAGGRELAALGRKKDELAAALTSRYNPIFSDPPPSPCFRLAAGPSTLRSHPSIPT